MSKIEISATPRAQEKYNEIVNGSKAEMNTFFADIEKNGIDKKKFEFLLKNDKDKFYYKQCKNVYLIFLIEDETTITILDFLSKIEFGSLKNKVD